MSYDLAVWHAARPLGAADASRIYGALSNDEVPPEIVPSAAMRRFAEEVDVLYPPLDRLSEKEAARSPWAGNGEAHDTHVLLSLRPSAAARMARKLQDLAKKHGVSFYDPQRNTLHLPDGSSPPPDADPYDAARDRFARLLERLRTGLAEHGFAWDELAQCFARSGKDLSRLIGLSLFRVSEAGKTSLELRAALTVMSVRLRKFRDAGAPGQVRGHDLASLDVRRLPQPPAWLAWDMSGANLWEGLAPVLLRFFRERAFPYFEQLEDPENLAQDLPGVKAADAIDYAIALDRKTLASEIARAFLARTPHDAAGFHAAVEAARSGREPSSGLPYSIRSVATAVARYGLDL